MTPPRRWPAFRAHARNADCPLTGGSILNSLVCLAGPIVITQLLQTAYHLTDTFWLGRLGADAVAAVSLGFPFFFLVLSLGGGMATAGTILVAQYTGRRDRQKVDYIASQTLSVICLLAVTLSVAGFLVSPRMISVMGVSPSVAGDALVYLQIIFAGMPVMFGFYVFQALLRGVGEVRVPMYITTGTVLLNLVLDPLFIFGWGPVPGLGVAGAALATLGTQALAAVVGVALLLRGSYGVRVDRREMRPDIPLAARMFRLGLPVSAEQFTVSLGIFVLVFLAASHGDLAAASYGIGTRIYSLALIPSLGFSMAVSTLVGQNMGAGLVPRAERISRLAMAMSFSLLTALGVLVFFLARPLAAFFIPGDPVVIRDSSTFIRVMCLTFGFMGLKQVVNGTLNGSGNTGTSMVLTFAYLWGMRVPAAWLLSGPAGLGERGVWWAFPFANVFGALLGAWFFRRGTWKEKDLAGEFDGKKKSPGPTPGT